MQHGQDLRLHLGINLLERRRRGKAQLTLQLVPGPLSRLRHLWIERKHQAERVSKKKLKGDIFSFFSPGNGSADLEKSEPFAAELHVDRLGYTQPQTVVQCLKAMQFRL